MKHATLLIFSTLLACSEPTTTPPTSSPPGGLDMRHEEMASSGEDGADELDLAASISDGVEDMSSADGEDQKESLDMAPRDMRGGEEMGSRCVALPSRVGQRLWPEPGELFYLQQGLGGVSLGEAAIVVGPNGKIVLIDAGNDSHDDDIIETLDAIIEKMNATPGFPTRASRAVDAVIITHYHSDHSDGLEDLLDKVTVEQIIYRGFVDLTDASRPATIRQLCRALHATRARSVTLCEAAAPGCTDGTWTGERHAAISCLGLSAGDLDGVASDAPSHLTLGDDARLLFVAANATIAGHAFEQEVAPLSTTESNAENSRSVVGVLSHGDFRLLFNGDLTGGGEETADIESFILPHLGEVSDIDERGVDVLHLGHHARETSSSMPWLDALLPNDGCQRNALSGISTAHLGSPHESVLERLFRGNRLSDGSFWSTEGHGDSTQGHISADGGDVILLTSNAGASYSLQLVDRNNQVTHHRHTLTARQCASGCD